MERREVKKVVEVKEAKEKHGGVAAFFDLDGTLTPGPSLEKRFFRRLRYRKLIGRANYLRWIWEAVRLAPRGIKQILYANKMYLRGVRAEETDDGRDKKQGHANAGWLSCAFFPEALERLAWHSEHGHAIVIVSGTLEPAAKKAALDLEDELAGRGIDILIEICATRLETADGKWTGRILGEAMFGEAKARAIRRFCASSGIEPSRCFAYGDSANDRWMLEAVGRPTAVNPSTDLARIAGRNGWPVLRWHGGGIFTHGSQNPQRKQNANAARKEGKFAAAKPGYWT
jgi:HAD superfamily hydrolase (TIGR01490 family)